MDLNDLLFSSFDRRYCNWFYVMMISSFISIVMFVVSMIILMMKEPKKLSPLMGWALIQLMATYISTRVWYSMCLR